METTDVRPNTGDQTPEMPANMAEFLANRKPVNHLEGLPEGEFLESELRVFEYYPGQTIDAYKYLFSESEEFVLETAPAMFTFFSLAGVKARIKEKKLIDLLKTFELSAIKKSDKRVAEQKGEARNTDRYKVLSGAIETVSRIRRRCEIMAKTMEKNFESVRTKSANTRTELQPGRYQHQS